jgi:hypothetical protein
MFEKMDANHDGALGVETSRAGSRPCVDAEEGVTALDAQVVTVSISQKIRELAHELWLTRGKREGHAQDDWLEAERRVLSEPTSARPVPLDEAQSIQPEIPKVGSRDAPGG